MNNTMTVISIAGAVAIGAISPGPSFLMVARTAVASSRTDGLFAAFGMGIGAMLFALAALLGLHTLLSAVPWIYMAVKIMGGMYLVYLGFKIYRGANKALILPDSSLTLQAGRASQAFLLGLFTQISNPKTAIVYASIFVALLPPDPAPSLIFTLPLIVLVIESGWYAIAALALSSPAPRGAYLRYKTWIDRTAGGVMGFLGLKLIVSAKE